MEAPSASQRRQSYATAADGNVQRPASAVSVSPTYALPAMLGGVTLSSASGATVAVRALAAVVAPPLEVAVTRTPMRWPTSAAESVYVLPVPASSQLALMPVASAAQRSQA